IDFEGEDANPRLVLNGVFTTDSVFTVELSNSSGYINNQPLNTISFGKVAVFDHDGEFLDSLHHTSNGIYKGSVIPFDNSTYSVIATAGNLGTVSAQDYIPNAVPVASWATTTVYVMEYDYTTEKLQLEFTLNDPAATDNFYVLEITHTQNYYVETNYDPNTGNMIYDTVYYENPMHSKMHFGTSDQILLSETDLVIDETLYYSNSLAFSDALFNGKTQTFRILIDQDYFGQQGVMELHLKSGSEAYFRYARSLQKYFDSENDPFAQPVQVYNNIENGIGIWAGYSVDIVEF